MIIDRMLNRLSHINPAIVLSASKVILKFSQSLDSPKLVEGLCRKISGSLVAIMGRSPEIVWVFLRNVEILLSKYPGVVNNPKAFFVNFNDPGFVKMQKVQILGLLCDEGSSKTIITELCEYSYDTNVEFSRFAFQNLWKIASRFESALDPVTKAIATILANAQDVGFIDHLLNEAALAVETLYRRYQNPVMLAEIFSFIVKSHSRINKSESMCGLLNVLPVYTQFDVQAYEIISRLVDTFSEQTSDIQLACLTCAVRLFTQDVARYQELMPKLLETIDRLIDNPDIRDRAFVYWRLLDLDPEIARAIVSGQKEKIEHSDSNTVNKALFEELFERIGGISATLQDANFFQSTALKRGSASVHQEESQGKPKQNKEDDILQLEADDLMSIDPVGLPPTTATSQTNGVAKAPVPAQSQTQNILDLHFDDFLGSKPATTSGLAQTRPPQASAETNTSALANSKNLELLMSDFDFSKPPQPIMVSPTPPPIVAQAEAARQSYEQNHDRYSSFNLLHLQDTPMASTVAQKSVDMTTPETKKPVEEAFEFDLGGFTVPPTKTRHQIKIEYKNKKPMTSVTFQTKGQKGKTGVQVQGTLRRENQLLFISLIIDNKSNSVLNELVFHLKPNAFGLVLRQTEVDAEIFAGSFLKVDLPIGFDQATKTGIWNDTDNTQFEIEFKSNYDTFVFKVECWLNNLFVYSLAFIKSD